MLRSWITTCIILTLAMGHAHAQELSAGPVKKIRGGFTFTEGPAFDKQGNLFFTDIPENKIYKLDASGALSVFHEHSNHADGLMFNQNGELIACEMEGQIAAYSPDGTRRVIAAQYKGARFNAPNDLAIDSSGGIYFTDPRFDAPAILPQGVEAVYYLSNNGKITRIIDNIKGPNGVILSPDQKTLYIIPTLQPEIMAYQVETPGIIGKERIFGTMKQPKGRPNHGGDGRAMDRQGNLYVATRLGMQIFSPAGKPLGIIAFPEEPTNATFAPDGKTLFVAARTSLYSVVLNSK